METADNPQKTATVDEVCAMVERAQKDLVSDEHAHSLALIAAVYLKAAFIITPKPESRDNSPVHYQQDQNTEAPAS